MEQENRAEELKRKLTELLNEYNEDPVPLGREERKRLESESELLKKYQKSKFRRNWLANVFGQFTIAEMWGIERAFFKQKMKEMKELLPFFAATQEELEANAEKIKELRGSNEFDVTPEIVERTNQMLREAIEQLS